MLSRLDISGFRCFKQLRIDHLKRVNLFVGNNNAGKTSVLEAIELVALGNTAALFRSPIRRDEQFVEGLTSEIRLDTVNLSYLFHGRDLRVGSTFSIKSMNQESLKVQCEILEAKPDQENNLLGTLPLDPEGPGPATLSFSGTRETRQFLMSLNGGASRRASLRTTTATGESGPVVNFVGIERPSPLRLAKLWDAVVLTPEEEGIVAALKIIEPRIERIAFLSETRSSPNVFLKLSDSERRLPLGSLGDGLRRLLTLSLHLFSTREGILLVDEIDTDLHYTVMADMWKVVIETARRLDVQVFATTHSLDCVRALAWIQEKHPDLSKEVILHRVEQDVPSTTSYSMDEIKVAAHSYIEVR